MALSTRIITSWRSRAGSPATTAGCGSTSTRTPRSVAGLPIAEAPSAATSPRSTGTRSSATAPESERASSSRSSTIAVMWRTSSSMSVERVADRRDRLVAVPLEVLDAAPDDGQRRAQLVAGVGGELALAAQRDALVGRATRGSGRAPAARRPSPNPNATMRTRTPADDQHDQDHLERLLLGRPVLDDLDGEDAARRDVDGLGQDAHRGVGELGGPHVAALPRRRR